MPGNSSKSAGAALLAWAEAEAFLVSYRPLATNILQTLGKQQHQVVRGSKIHDDGERRKPSRR